MKPCPWYNEKINILSLVLPHHKNFKPIDNTSLSQFGFSKSDHTKYNEIKYCYDKGHGDMVIKTFTYTLNLTEDQKNLLLQWFEICNSVYNNCVMMYNKNPKQFSLNYKAQKLVIFKYMFKNEKKPVPYDILTGVVQQFCTNVKTAITNVRNGNIKKFRMKLKINPMKYSIVIPKKSINSDGFFPRFLSKINQFTNIDVEKIECDSKLVYINKKFYLKCPMKVQTEEQIKSNIVALDPGECNFMGFYSPNESGLIGSNMRKRIINIRNKIKIVDRSISKRINRNKTKLRNVKKLRKLKQSYHNKIKNIVKEMHNQTSLYLVKNYSKIIIPVFETQNMVKCYGKKYITKIKEELKDYPEKLSKEIKRVNKIRKLSKTQKFVLNSLSHFTFREHLKHKCKEYNCELQVVTEEYTSQCCGVCGLLSQVYDTRTKMCPYCGYICDRDINGSRNILLKNSQNNIQTCLYYQ